jgi:hypothetical protein
MIGIQSHLHNKSTKANFRGGEGERDKQHIHCQGCTGQGATRRRFRLRGTTKQGKKQDLQSDNNKLIRGEDSKPIPAVKRRIMATRGQTSSLRYSFNIDRPHHCNYYAFLCDPYMHELKTVDIMAFHSQDQSIQHS